MFNIPEADWKYLRGIKDELLAEMCRRCNDEALQILWNASAGEHEKFLALYRHAQSSNDMIAACFDDWRRSTAPMRLLALRQHRLLTDVHLSRLSLEIREGLKNT